MSQLLKLMKDDLHKAMKREVQIRKDTNPSGTIYNACIAVKHVARSIISMFPEIGIKPDKASDDDSIKLLKKYISIEKIGELYIQHHLSGTMVIGLSSKELNALQKNTIIYMGDELTSMNISIAKSYLPKEAGVVEIKEWIEKNIDFSQYKNKMQAMGPIMKEFKGCDGNVVKQLILSM